VLEFSRPPAAHQFSQFPGVVREELERRPLLAALDMLRVVRELDAPFSARGWPSIRVGVGIASGPMNVGNMGSEFRIAYTVMGDTVNLGSRLEGLTKQYGVDIIVNDVAAGQVPEFAFRELDRVQVKGKSEPVAIFEPIGPRQALSAEAAERLAAYTAALALYRDQQWDAASDAFMTLRQHSDDLLYNVYLDRIRNFRQSPPPASWDGVFAHLNK
jgi:adenylate cyclase